MEGRYILDFGKGDCPVVIAALAKEEQERHRCEVLVTRDRTAVEAGRDTCGLPVYCSVFWEYRNKSVLTCEFHVDQVLSNQKSAKK